ncbi:MAG: DUF721 domain-containing protein [Holosporaceae bacterium]|jgi:hypothetical protein|nr:DUF721 domain-containing protein [Holosporaceae bacterium]
MSHLQNLLPIARIAKDLIQKTVNKPDYLEIFSNWNEIVGEQFSTICLPYKAVNLGKDKILILKTIRGRGLEVQHEACKILDLVNNFLKKKTFSQIKIIQMDIY